MAKKKPSQDEMLKILTNRTPGYDLDKIAKQAGFDDFFDYTEDEALEEFIPLEHKTTRPWGGKREGAGGKKPKLPASEKRKPITVRIHPRVIEILKQHPKGQAKAIEELVCDKHGIEL